MTERNVVISLIQADGHSTDNEVNKKNNLERIDQAAKEKPDFIVFDELSTTPYFCAAKKNVEYFKWAETIPGPYIERVGQKARKYGCCIIVPVFEKFSDKYFNSAAVVGPDGNLIQGRLPDGSSVHRYAKVHVPVLYMKELPINEKNYFSPGPGFPVFKTPKATIGLAICYDRRFPEACRTLTLQGAEIVFLPTDAPFHPMQSDEVYYSETRAAASQNHVFFVSCNQVGPETFEGTTTNYIGRSCVVGPDGLLVDQPASPDKPAILTVKIDLSKIAESEDRLRLLHDRRPETYLLEAPKQAPRAT